MLVRGTSMAGCSPDSSTAACVTHAFAGIATFERSILKAISSEGFRSPESHRLTTPGFTPRATARSAWDHSSFSSRARNCSAAEIESAMAKLLTADNYLSIVKCTERRTSAVATWQDGPVAKPSFRENLKTFIEASGLSQAEVAARVRVTGGALSRWLKKVNGPLPGAQHFLALARVLGVDPWMLVGSSFEEPAGAREVAPPGRRRKDAAIERGFTLTPKSAPAAPRAQPVVREKRRRAD